MNQLFTLELGRTNTFQEAVAEAEEVTMQYAVLVVGLTRSRGVSRVMPAEDLTIHSKGLAFYRKEKDNNYAIP